MIGEILTTRDNETMILNKADMADDSMEIKILLDKVSDNLQHKINKALKTEIKKSDKEKSIFMDWRKAEIYEMHLEICKYRKHEIHHENNFKRKEKATESNILVTFYDPTNNYYDCLRVKVNLDELKNKAEIKRLLHESVDNFVM